jgi:cytochrome c oxidase subunit II
VTPFAGALALAGVATAASGGISPVTPVSPNGHRISDAFWLILGVTGAIFLLVEGTLLAFVIRYRRRGRPSTAEPPQIHGATRVEIVWTVIPVLILAAIVSFVFYKLPGIKNTPPATAAGDRMNVKVEAHQFYWLFRYPDGREAINLLTVPRGQIVTLDVTTADVAHSWWVPAFGGKIDAIPGTTNHTWFKAEKAGAYPIRCAEFCGIQHAVMTATVEVLPPAAFRSWLARQRASAADLGKELFVGVCAKCHGFRGQGAIGPALTAPSVAADRRTLAQTIRNGIRTMPAVGKNWTDREVNAVIDYIKRNVATGGATGGG